MSWKLAIGSTAKIQRNESINRYLGRMKTMATYVWKEFQNEMQKNSTRILHEQEKKTNPNRRYGNESIAWKIETLCHWV